MRENTITKESADVKMSSDAFPGCDESVSIQVDALCTASESAKKIRGKSNATGKECGKDMGMSSGQSPSKNKRKDTNCGKNWNIDKSKKKTGTSGKSASVDVTGTHQK